MLKNIIAKNQALQIAFYIPCILTHTRTHTHTHTPHTHTHKHASRPPR